jgi:Fe2+ transport system protein B
MGFFTRKNNKNNALKEAYNVEQRAAYNLEHKHSKVGNVLSSPGKIKSLNAERIKKNADKKIDNIAKKYSVNVDELRRELQKDKIEPSKLVESAKELKEIVEKEMKSNDGNITISLNHSLAKILLFILNIVIFFIVSMLGVFQIVLLLLSSASGLISSSSETSKFWDWILKGKWIVSMSSLYNDKNSMNYYNNPLHR